MEENRAYPVDGKTQKAKDLARKYMRQGWGSRASVLHAIYDLFDTGFSQKDFLNFCRILNPFHAPAGAIYENGIGFGLNTCGAVTGALASFALVHGLRYNADGPILPGGGWENMYKDIMINPALPAEEKLHKYADELNSIGCGAYYQIVVRFKSCMGSTDCLALRRPYHGGDPLSKKAFKICNEAVIQAACIATEVILEYEENPESLQIGQKHVHYVELNDGKS